MKQYNVEGTPRQKSAGKMPTALVMPAQNKIFFFECIKKPRILQGYIYLLQIIVSDLYHYHGIAITEKTVLVFDGFFIGFHGQVITGKSTGHDQQAGLGK